MDVLVDVWAQRKREFDQLWGRWIGDKKPWFAGVIRVAPGTPFGGLRKAMKAEKLVEERTSTALEDAAAVKWEMGIVAHYGSLADEKDIRSWVEMCARQLREG